MTEPGLQFEEVRDGKRKWIEPRFTVGNLIELVGIALAAAGLYYGIIGVQRSQGEDIARLQAETSAIPSMESDIRVMQSSNSNLHSARDQQVTGIQNQVDMLGNRVDRVETSVDTKLGDMARDIATIQANVAAIAGALGTVPRVHP